LVYTGFLLKQGPVYTEFFFIHGADNTGLLLIENLVYTGYLFTQMGSDYTSFNVNLIISARRINTSVTRAAFSTIHATSLSTTIITPTTTVPTVTEHVGSPSNSQQ
jgi:hypothetical protein